MVDALYMELDELSIGGRYNNTRMMECFQEEVVLVINRISILE